MQMSFFLWGYFDFCWSFNSAKSENWSKTEGADIHLQPPCVATVTCLWSRFISACSQNQWQFLKGIGKQASENSFRKQLRISGDALRYPCVFTGRLMHCWGGGRGGDMKMRMVSFHDWRWRWLGLRCCIAKSSEGECQHPEILKSN